MTGKQIRRIKYINKEGRASSRVLHYSLLRQTKHFSLILKDKNWTLT